LKFFSPYFYFFRSSFSFTVHCIHSPLLSPLSSFPRHKDPTTATVCNAVLFRSLLGSKLPAVRSSHCSIIYHVRTDIYTVECKTLFLSFAWLTKIFLH
jgi:hypothetical protein